MKCLTQEQASGYEWMIAEERDAERRKKQEEANAHTRAVQQGKAAEEARKQALKRKLEEQLAAKIKKEEETARNDLLRGRAIESQTANSVLPYAMMSRDAYGESGNGATKFGYRRAFEWDAFLNANGKNQEVSQWKKDGFSASVFMKGTTRDKNQEVVIAFQGSNFEPR